MNGELIGIQSEHCDVAPNVLPLSGQGIDRFIEAYEPVPVVVVLEDVDRDRPHEPGGEDPGRGTRA